MNDKLRKLRRNMESSRKRNDYQTYVFNNSQDRAKSVGSACL